MVLEVGNGTMPVLSACLQLSLEVAAVYYSTVDADSSACVQVQFPDALSLGPFISLNASSVF